MSDKTCKTCEHYRGPVSIPGRQTYHRCARLPFDYEVLTPCSSYVHKSGPTSCFGCQYYTKGEPTIYGTPAGTCSRLNGARVERDMGRCPVDHYGGDSVGEEGNGIKEKERTGMNPYRVIVYEICTDECKEPKILFEKTFLSLSGSQDFEAGRLVERAGITQPLTALRVYVKEAP